MHAGLTDIGITFLTSLGLTTETANASDLSKAASYEACYNWYITDQNVLPENAALASKVWVQKYCLIDENGICVEKDPTQMWDRLAETLAGVEVLTNSVNKDFDTWKNYFRKGLQDYAYSPQGSGLYSLGNPYVRASSSNCFVLPPPTDSLEGIFEAGKNTAKIYASRGGVGLSLSKLRPRKAKTANAAKTSTGAVSFMDFYSYITGMIGQEGRRGAEMLSLEVSHPDIFDFIKEKRDADKQGFFSELSEKGIDINDYRYSAIADRLKSTSHANVSVMINDHFMDCVKKDLDYELRFDFENDLYAPIIKVVKATAIWNELMKSAWESAEPGILNWDHILRECPADQYAKENKYDWFDPVTNELKLTKYSFRTVGVNPCLSGDTWVLTSEGAKQINDLIDVPHQTVHNGKLYNATGFWKTGDKEVFKIETNRGYSVKATDNHKFLTQSGKAQGWKEVKDLAVGDKLVLSNNKGFKWDGGTGIFNEGYLVGSVVGDGQYGESNLAAVSFWGDEKKVMADMAINMIKELPAIQSPTQFGSNISLKNDTKLVIHSKQLDILCSQYIEKTTKAILPAVEKASHAFICGFLRGFFDADGTVSSNTWKGSSVRLNQSDITKLQVVQRLLSRLGILSTVYTNRHKAGPQNMPDGRGGIKSYIRKANHDLHISKDSILTFSEVIGFGSPIKQKILSSISRVYSDLLTTTITSITPAGIEPVYDCTVDQVHCFDANGCVAHNCAEETLSAYDSCNLGIFNLPLFVVRGYTEIADFDWDRYREVIELGIRAQDNIKEWDIPRLPLEGNRMAGILGRRISVGNTGLADCLAALGLRYDSNEGIAMAEKIYEFMCNIAYRSSALLAEEKGAFPAFDLKKHLNSPFIQRLQPDTLDLIKKHGLRNIGLLTQAPAGSMSILFRNCASGIEPVFMLSYTRNVKKQGTKDFEQHIINHQAVEDCFQAGGDPAVFVPAASIDYSKRIEMQSRIQKHIDHSISSTINLPNSVTVEEVSKIYMEAYDAGLKGITVYRDGCRTGVLVSSEKKPNIHRPGQVIERPKTTDIDIFKTRYKDKAYMILVGKVENGHPVEIFGGLEDGLSLPTQYKSATLTKKSRGHYSLTIQLSDDEEDIMKVNNIGNRFPAQDIMTLTRMISLSLRNGISVSDIVEQLNKATTALYDAPAVFARVLKQYISDEDAINKEKSKGKVCPECGEALEYKRESGCVVELCSSCTYSNSKCG